MATSKTPTARTITKTTKKVVAPAVAKPTSSKQAAGAKSAANKAAGKVAGKKVPSGKTIQAPAGKAGSAIKPTPAAATAPKPAAAQRTRKKISTGQALANTLALLKAKNEKARQPPNYPTGDAAHPGSHGPHAIDAAQAETAPTARLTEAIHGHAYATERGDESKRGQS